MNLVARCKASALESRAHSNPYNTTEGRAIAFWHTLFADNIGYGQYPSCSYSVLEPEDYKKEYAGLQDWLAPISDNWTPEPPRVTETSVGRLHAGVWSALIARAFSGPEYKVSGEGSGIEIDFLPTTWSAEQLEERTKEFNGLAKTWGRGPYDFIKSPFWLPNVVPDPFLRFRGADQNIRTHVSGV